MCTGIVETVRVSGSGKGAEGWFKLEQVSVSYDHPDHSPGESALTLDFASPSEGLSARVAVELAPESGKELVRAILTALSRGGVQTS